MKECVCLCVGGGGGVNRVLGGRGRRRCSAGGEKGYEGSYVDDRLASDRPGSCQRKALQPLANARLPETRSGTKRLDSGIEIRRWKEESEENDMRIVRKDKGE